MKNHSLLMEFRREMDCQSLQCAYRAHVVSPILPVLCSKCFVTDQSFPCDRTFSSFYSGAHSHLPWAWLCCRSATGPRARSSVRPTAGRAPGFVSFLAALLRAFPWALEAISPGLEILQKLHGSQTGAGDAVSQLPPL